MILDELVLHNFGIYRGQHRTLLTPTQNRPIILFGALNGSGKTTFMEGMQLALYGRAVASRGRHAYHDYLARSVNKYVSPVDGAGIELAFRYWTDGNLQPVRLKRTWHQSGKTVKEAFEVWRNDTLDTVATERWAEFVEEIIPNQIADLFFFDGEKIEGLADPNQSSALLRVGLHSLLGLDLVDHLIRSLIVVERRRKATGLDAPDRTVVEKLDEQIAQLERQRATIREQVAEINSQIDQRRNDASKWEKQLESSGGHLLGRRKELETEYQNLKREREQIDGELTALAAGDAPLLLLEPLLAELESVVVNTLEGVSETRLDVLMKRRDRQVLTKLAKLGVGTKRVEAMRKYLSDSRPTKNTDGRQDFPVGLTPARLLTPTEAEMIRDSLRRQLNHLKRLSAQLDACERNLGAIPEEDAVRGPLEGLRSTEHELDRLKIRGSILNEDEARLSAEIGRLDAQRRVKLEQVADYQLAAATAQRILKHSLRARATLGKYREEIAQRHMVRLETLITECFARLHRKKSIKYSISIDRDKYELRLTEDAGYHIEADELSAGERQLLAVSVLWALAQASGRRLPTVIDTPLGRLDGPHRHLLVEHYFPHASHQVILFSTDEEVTPEYYQRLAHAVGREYSIVYDEGRQTSTIVDGYLKPTALAA